MAATKSVQQMSMDGDEPPERYFVKDGRFGAIDTSPPQASIPIINMSLFSSSSSPSSKEEKEELNKLRSAFCSWGCIQIVGHGIPETFLDKVREIVMQFFELPMGEKQKHSQEPDNFEGYGNDLIVSDKQVLDWLDRLRLMVLPEDKQNLSYWPKDPKNFREILVEYSMKTKLVMKDLFKAMAKSLNLEENSFEKKFEARSILKARMSFYPICPKPDQILGLKPHSDSSGITTILQNKEVQGLQVFKENQWFGVTPLPHTIFVNLGDQMQILSNGMFKSPLHRVVTNTKATRISIAMFIEPEPEEDIGPVDGLIEENRPRLYRTVKNYAQFNYESFQKGQIALEAARI
ncbi:Isopenicillin N synthase-like, Fe(2+) 2OG dioxygenase domain [Dillenia turbinata]|uniref:Isopenicillin N synthase-like, Fe(2+) 2OG dioxygenase domain n=1 Tax=Dillenia turbinata TaxID=194707 RepID=A0AAN8W4G8_9MAGN